MFSRIDKPNMYGWTATTDSGLELEVVQCYEGQWDLFITRNGSVVACSIEAYRQWGHGYTPKAQVMQVAKKLLDL